MDTFSNVTIVVYIDDCSNDPYDDDDLGDNNDYDNHGNYDDNGDDKSDDDGDDNGDGNADGDNDDDGDDDDDYNDGEEDKKNGDNSCDGRCFNLIPLLVSRPNRRYNAKQITAMIRVYLNWVKLHIWVNN